MKGSRIIVAALAAGLAAGCTIRTPEVTFTSERTALEKQILGSYRTIEDDAWMISSERGLPAARIAMTEDRREALEAVASRKFNADDVEDFKRDEAVGENVQGLLTVRPTPQYEQDQAYRALVDRVVADENHDRSVIITYIVDLNREINPLPLGAVAQAFARMEQQASPPGTWIQKADLSWTRK